MCVYVHVYVIILLEKRSSDYAILTGKVDLPIAAFYFFPLTQNK